VNTRRSEGPALSEPALPDEHVRWCTQQICQWAGRPVRIDRFERVASRLAVLHRVLVDDAGRCLEFFLKSYPQSVEGPQLADHLRTLCLVQQAMSRDTRLAPFPMVAADANLRLLLMLPMPGHRLSDLHAALWRRETRAMALNAWRGLGMWLAALHWNAQAPITSTTHLRTLCEYSRERFQQWASCDPSMARLSQDACTALSNASEAWGNRPVTLTLCHGDVCPANVFAGERVGLIDLDDLRLDMPALDLSQALLYLHDFGRLLSLVPFPRFGGRAREALEAGYGRPFPTGLEFAVPHLRNLSVFLVTLAQRMAGGRLGVSDRLQYRWVIEELRRTVTGIVRRPRAAAHGISGPSASSGVQ